MSSGQKQFCLRTTFTEFADNVSHDSIFLQKKKKKDIAGKIDLINRAAKGKIK